MTSEDIKHGIIFRSEDDTIYLGLYENNRITIFNNISDFEGIYTTFPLEKAVLVEVSVGENDSFWIKDLVSYEIGRTGTGDFVPASMEIMLEELKFPSDETDDMFASFLTDAGKSH